MTFPLQITFSLTPVLNLLFVPNKIDCVLPRWRDNLLSINQLLTYSSCIGVHIRNTFRIGPILFSHLSAWLCNNNSHTIFFIMFCILYCYFIKKVVLTLQATIGNHKHGMIPWPDCFGSDGQVIAVVTQIYPRQSRIKYDVIHRMDWQLRFAAGILHTQNPSTWNRLKRYVTARWYCVTSHTLFSAHFVPTYEGDFMHHTVFNSASIHPTHARMDSPI